MKNTFTTAFLLFFYVACWAQGVNVYNFNDPYYEKTDFNLVDTLDQWGFRLDATYRGRDSDSIKPIGVIMFYRKSPITDSKFTKMNKKSRYPYLIFDIFNLSDTVYCKQASENTRYYSSCSPPFTGGDILIIGGFVLLNRQVCETFAIHWDTNSDVTRPVVNAAFFKTSLNDIHIFEDFLSQLPISGELIR